MKPALKLEFAALALLLAACSTGGGGGGGSGEGGGGLGAGNALIAPMSSITGTLGDWTVADATYAPGQGGSVQVSWDKGSLSGKTRTFEPYSPGTYALDSSGENGFLTVIASTGNALALEGIITESDLSEGAYGLVHVGTAPTNIPTSGTLTYSGSDAVVIGPTVDQCGLSVNCVGDVSINANFSSGAVTGTFSNFNGGLSNVGFTGAMNSGNALYSSTSLTYGGSPVSGTLLGGFYGAGASDTAGVVDVTLNNVRYLGGYAASVEH